MSTPDPTEIHPEYDRPTPQNIEEWDESQLEAYNEAKDAELTAEAEANRVELAADEKETLETIRSATRRDETLTEEVDLAEAFNGADEPIPVTVTKKLTGGLETKLDRIASEQRKDVPRIAEIRDAVIDAIVALIVDDGEDGRYTFRSRALWEAYYYDEGMVGLMNVFDVVADPALERYERLGNSRSRTRQ